MNSLSEKQFNEWLDRYLVEGVGDVEQYLQMDDEQKNIIQIIKRSIKRIKYKNENNQH
jgi:hypothetical protein